MQRTYGTQIMFYSIFSTHALSLRDNSLTGIASVYIVEIPMPYVTPWVTNRDNVEIFVP